MTIDKVRVLVGKQFGLSEADSRYPGNLEPALRVKLFDYTSAYVVQHPEQFSNDVVERAKRAFAAWGTNTPLQDTSFDWGQLASEVGNNIVEAGDSVAGVGRGVLSAFKLSAWLIPLVFVAVVVIYLHKFAKK